MSLGRLLLIASIALGAFLALWLLSQRRIAEGMPGRALESPDGWLRLE